MLCTNGRCCTTSAEFRVLVTRKRSWLLGWFWWLFSWWSSSALFFRQCQRPVGIQRTGHRRAAEVPPSRPTVLRTALSPHCSTARSHSRPLSRLYCPARLHDGALHFGVPTGVYNYNLYHFTLFDFDWRNNWQTAIASKLIAYCMALSQWFSVGFYRKAFLHLLCLFLTIGER